MTRRAYLALVIGFVLLCATGAFLIVTTSAVAQSGVIGALAPLGTGFTFQGELKDDGNPVSAACDMQFALYDAASGGSQIGSTQTVAGVEVDTGRFSVVLNESAQFGSSAFVGDARWLGISVRCPAGSGSYTNLTPRQGLTAAPYAIYATTAGTMSWSGLTGLSCSNNQVVAWDGSKWICSDANEHNHGGQDWVGVGTYGLRVENSSGLDFTSGLTGVSSGTGGRTSGVYGLANSTSGGGVRGQGIGMGVIGQTDSSTVFAGLAGLAPQPTGLTSGVIASSSSISGTGVYGYVDVASGSDAVGVYGETSAPGGRGVVGYATDTTGTNAGIFGRTASPNGFAGFFLGDVAVQGDFFAAGSKAFQIDHPLEPDNKWLRHAAVESPAMMNIYNGNVSLDSSGEAWVLLPDYFEALNRDFRYQLTPIGGPGPNLFIAVPIEGNQFKIGGGSANLEVSWQVTGVRQDSYAAANPLIVEEEKAGGVTSATQQVPLWDDSGRSGAGKRLEQMMAYPPEGQASSDASQWGGQ